MANFRADYNSVEVSSSIAGGDPSFRQSVNKIIPNFGAGIYYSASRFYLGISVPHMINNSLNTNDFGISNSLINRQYFQYFVITGYSFELNPNLSLKPSILLKAVKGAPLQVDVSSTLWLRDRIAFGFSYRSAADLVFMLQLQATEQFRIGYAYDYGLNRINEFSHGSHEIMVRYEFGSGKDKVLSPRSF